VATLVQLNGEGGLGWRELKCFGADIGSANLAFFLKKGWIALPPVETSLNQGKLKLAIGVRLDPGPSELVFYPGTTVERAVVTPQMCADALGYVAPALAKAAEAEGTFSMTIDSGRVPLGRPESGDLAGKITLHSVRVGPGPLMKELSVLSTNPNSITLAKEQVVPFRMVNGRVHHENLKLSFPELTITTSGSVGIDGTLDLVAEMPIPPKWLGKTPLAASLAKQTLRLPINGTLSQPKLNEQALRNLFAQFARDTTKDFLKEELEKKFQKLIRP
jgi:translocation and assembly module TamB